MKNVFYAIVDEDGLFVDEECFYYDKKKKQLECIRYHDFYNHITMSDTYDRAKLMKTNIDQVCQKYNVHKEIKINEIMI